MTKKQRLAGKIAIVTGAGRNIGRAEALLLADQGCSVVVNDIPPEAGAPSLASAVVEEIRNQGGQAIAVDASTTTMEAGQRLVEAAVETFGAVDIVVNNAGVVQPARIDRMTEAQWHHVVDVNLKGTFAVTRFATEQMVRQGRGGVIINTSSPSGFGHYAMSNYTAAKEGVVGFTRSVARDLGEFGIRCNAIRPVSHLTGTFTKELVETIEASAALGQTLLWNRHMTNPRMQALPEHVAALVVWLCTDAAAHVSGRDFFVQGDEIGLLPEPELIRTVFKAEGWDLDSLDQTETAHYLIGDIPNRFVRSAPGRNG